MACHMPDDVIKGSRNCQTSQNRSGIFTSRKRWFEQFIYQELLSLWPLKASD